LTTEFLTFGSDQVFVRFAQFRSQPAEIRLDGLLQLLVCMPLVIPELRELIADPLSQAGELLL
jgi:hypothetical protein